MRPLRASLAELAAAVPGLRLAGDPSTVVQGVTYDSRMVEPGSLFVALRGGYFDGHTFAEEARDRGAAALLVERSLGIGLPELIAADTRAALPGVAAALYGRPAECLGVIGITGTDGKTTTSYLVDAILRAAGLRTGMIGTVAVRIADQVVDHETRQTTPESADVQRLLRRMVDAGVDWAIVEATSHGLDLHRLDETRFLVGAVTNITHEHLEHHGTVAAYRRAKAILFERVAAAGGEAVVNLDDAGAREMLDYCGGARVITYSMSGRSADVMAVDLRLGVDGSSFRLRTSDGDWPIELPLVGGFNVANALCAVGVAMALGVDRETMRGALEQAPAVPGRMARVEQGQPFAVIVDYAHTPESLTKVLGLLRSLNPRGRLIVVTGSAGERDVEKRPLQGAVCARLADVSVFTTEDPRFEDADAIIAQIAGGAAGAGGREGETFLRVTDRRAAIRLACELASPGDTLLLAGKGHEQSIIWGLEKRPWDEERVAREVLTELGYGAGR